MFAKGWTSRESVSVSFEPCYGFCPVYDLKIQADGTVLFHGERHTAVLGDRSVRKTPATYRRVLRSLASFRPANGTTADTKCVDRVTDHPHFRIVWKESNGRETVLRHDTGCFSPTNKRLNAAVDHLPGLLGVAGYAKQTQSPGVSRG
ncbi:hypothetical protein CAF53_01665 [Sphingobium sp. LB126]|nr:hypothetical protein CAF53_01665 [Sphingobium sp. LB126]